MSYYNDYLNHTYGANYLLNYNDDGGTGMDGYPNIIVGGVKIGKNWYSGDKSKVGMPVKIKDISSTMSIEWINSESNATDENDKWMASINFIFDNNGTENSIPDSSLRDYDLVIESFSYNFDNSTNDISTSSNGVIYFFARDDNKQIKPYTITYQNKTYTYAVRYKFFNTGGDKDDKIHVKFIPYGKNGIVPVLKVNVKDIIAASKNYVQFANIPESKKHLIDKLAPDDCWLKSINAGYEVYAGKSNLKIDKFKIIP